MNVDAGWPHISDPLNITEADHAAHTNPKGTLYPHDLIEGESAKKMAKIAGKVGFKKHLTLKGKISKMGKMKVKKKL